MKKLSLLYFLIIVLINDIKSQCTGSSCVCAETAEPAPTCGDLEAEQDFKCVSKDNDDEDRANHPCKETPIVKVDNCSGSVCKCAKAGETKTCTDLSVQQDYKCEVNNDDNTKNTYACKETPIVKVDNCSGSVCKCAKAGETKTCTDLSVQENYKCEVNDNEETKKTYACKETATSTSEETSKETSKDNSQTLSISFMICLITLFFKF